jgi:hypothetical protein
LHGSFLLARASSTKRTASANKTSFFSNARSGFSKTFPCTGAIGGITTSIIQAGFHMNRLRARNSARVRGAQPGDGIGCWGSSRVRRRSIRHCLSVGFLKTVTRRPSHSYRNVSVCGDQPRWRRIGGRTHRSPPGRRLTLTRRCFFDDGFHGFSSGLLGDGERGGRSIGLCGGPTVGPAARTIPRRDGVFRESAQ